MEVQYVPDQPGRPISLWVISLICSLCLFHSAGNAQLHHDLNITLVPGDHRLTVTDTITLPKNHPHEFRFQLHQGLEPTVMDAGISLKRLSDKQSGQHTDMDPALRAHTVPVEEYLVRLPEGSRTVTLQYSGAIHHPIEQHSEEYARSFSISPGLISPDGVFLAASSYWYPTIDKQLLSFTMKVMAPDGWRAISQGKRLNHANRANQHQVTWSEEHPQEEIYLVAASFIEYQQEIGDKQAMVFLRNPDPALAQKYLDTTHRYLDMYQRLLGEYPYQKFALVENFWETGYGMPSFTLLGPKVIRFPFILHSSYPHEVLHNWWGNGVYVDYDTGNWAEGLTTYLADHLIKEQRQQASAYRRSTLLAYSNYVREQSDFPLTEFRGRHSSVTQAVGYGKTLFLFHMLRRHLGDQAFIETLRKFYQAYRYSKASFADIEKAFGQYSKVPLTTFFQQWIRRAGAPALRIMQASTKATGNGYQLEFDIEQIQTGEPYHLRVPVAVHMQDAGQAYQTEVRLTTKQQSFTLQLPARPVQLDVDPQFDVFRRLHYKEVPATLSQAFGAERALIVIPAGASSTQQQAYREVAKSWQQGRDSEIEIRLDNSLKSLPSDQMIWLFGWNNRFRTVVDKALGDFDYKSTGNNIILDGKTLQRKQHSVALMARNPANAQQAIAWLATENPKALPGLARKLPHYGKYSYLGFQGDEPTNVAKGQWPVIDSPMSIVVQQGDKSRVKPTRARLMPRVPLIQSSAQFSSERLLQDIATLADPEMGGRGLGSPDIDRSADYIARQFQRAGLQPGGDTENSYYQAWSMQLPDRPHRDYLKNVIAVLPGSNPDFSRQSVVITAHYDHLGHGWPDVHQGDEGKIHPGADDNASGVAVLLELARHFARRTPLQRSIVFIAFTGEEAGRLGSKHYVRHALNYPTDQITGVINLDTVGRLHDRHLLVLGSGTAYEWPHIFRGAGYVTGVPIKAVANDVGGSDQVSFQDAGVPAVQLFAGAHADYHRPGDTVDKIDSKGLLKITAVVKEAAEYLAERPEPMRVTLGNRKGQAVPSASAQGRRVRLGTVPDFAFAGPGVKLTEVSPDTPAARAGLQADDVIVQINNTRIGNLKDYGKVLRKLNPGDTVSIHFLRNNQQQSVDTTAEAR